MNPVIELYSSPRLLADIGGTYARFALELTSKKIYEIRVLTCADFASLEDCVRAYLMQIELIETIPTEAMHLIKLKNIKHAAFAIANPVDGDLVQMTNHHWRFSIEATRNNLGLDTLLVINDFTALAMSLPFLDESQCVQIGDGKPKQFGVKGLIGPGTGFGVSGLIYHKNTWVALNSEGGHQSFAPYDELEVEILRYLRTNFTHISNERLISGPGIANIYQAIAAIKNSPSLLQLLPDEIFKRAGLGDALCIEVLQIFCKILGSVAGDIALTLGSVGGMYIGGGIVQQLDNLFFPELFRQRFIAKGRFSAFLEKIPTYIIAATYPAFFGISLMLSLHLERF